jgi:hypothetical protein
MSIEELSEAYRAALTEVARTRSELYEAIRRERSKPGRRSLGIIADITGLSKGRIQQIEKN